MNCFSITSGNHQGMIALINYKYILMGSVFKSMMNKTKLVALVMLVMCLGVVNVASAANVTTQPNGGTWYDTNNNIVNCHATSYIRVGDKYYMFGEKRVDSTNIFHSFVCYSSTNLSDWTFEGTVLTADDVSSDGRIATRAKVIYNDATGKYVMYFKFKNAGGGNRTYGVATCDTVNGHYTFQGRDYPSGGDFGDGSLFKDDDNKAYLVYSYLNASNVRELRIDQLTSDYLDVSHNVKTFTYNDLGSKREAPNIFKTNGYYYIITSGVSGWQPNQAQFMKSTSLSGGWSGLMNFCDSSITYDSQGSDVMVVEGSQQTTFIFVSDRWNWVKYENGTLLHTPIQFNGSDIYIEYMKDFSIDASTGTWSAGLNDWWKYIKNEENNVKLFGDESGPAVTLGDGTWTGEGVQWSLAHVPEEPGYYYIDNNRIGMRLSVVNDNVVFVESKKYKEAQKWQVIDAGNGYYYILSKSADKKLRAKDSTTLELYSKSAMGAKVKWKIIDVN